MSTSQTTTNPIIEIVSASAGSGKTYTLAQKLEQAVLSGDARPQCILATTFTRKAAAELMQRTRTRLLAAGRPTEAQLLDASRIGTVNSVCDRIVREYAFELGQSTELEVLDQPLARAAFREVVTGSVLPQERDQLQDLGRRFTNFDWREVINQLVDLARANGMSANVLSEQCDESLESYRHAFDCSGAAAPIEAALEHAYETAISAIREVEEAGGKVPKNARDALNDARKLVNTLGRDELPKWNDWRRVAHAGNKKPYIAPLKQAAAAYDLHPALWDDISNAIRITHTIAHRALARYQKHKHAYGLVDFIDQERLALAALEIPAVCDSLADELDLVLVDEFQDTSPVQLKLFTALAKLAKRSIWVGDQKQSIFGFRGTDPELMQATIEALAPHQPMQTLAKSWRSRASLVDLTNRAFVEAFKTHGVPPDRMQLEPAHTQDPQDLGPAVEAWRLDGKKLERHAASLAHAVAKLLAERPPIRDPEHPTEPGDEPTLRSARGGDVAILCRRNAHCQRVAQALAAEGIRSRVARSGLCGTLEGALVQAGLRLWADPLDARAAANLARLVTDTPEDEWFANLLNDRDAALSTPEVLAIQQAAKARPQAGPVSAFDAVLRAVDALAWCERWGDAPQRLANLDQLRAHAVTYTDTAAALGHGASPAGLSVWLEEREGEDDDDRASFGDPDTVHVCTRHAAKGLEWPIVIITELVEQEPRALGVSAYSDQTAFDIDAPLAHRRLRYWPSPFSPQTKTSEYHDRLKTLPQFERLQNRQRYEELRLLYVAWTRARDRLVFAGAKKELDGHASVLALLGKQQSSDTRLTVADVEIPIVRCPEPDESTSLKPNPGQLFDSAAAPTQPGPLFPARVRPSDAPAPQPPPPVELITIGEPVHTESGLQPEDLGNALHGILAVDQGLDAAERRRVFDEHMGRFGLDGRVDTPGLMANLDAFRDWCAKRLPGHEAKAEVPMAMLDGNGTMIGGTADLLLEGSDAAIVVDHKSRRGTDEELREYAQEVAGQLGCYAEVVEGVRPGVEVGRVVFFAYAGVVGVVG